MTPFRERNPIWVGAVSVAVLTVAMLFAFSLERLTFLRGVYTVHAEFADAAGLVPENEVRVAGLKVGKVQTIELAGPGGQGLAAGTSAQEAAVRDRVRVTMEVERGIELGGATTAEIKLKTLLGSKFVDLAPRGGEPLLGDGDTIPLERTSIPFELYQATNRTVESIGALDAEALNDALRKLAEVTEDPSGNLGRALEGLADATEALSERDADLESLLRASDRLTEVLSQRSGELGRIIDSSATLLGALSDRRAALKDFLRGTDRLSGELGGLLADTRSDLDPALSHLHTILEVVRGRQGELDDAVQALGPSAESFGRVFTQGTWGDVWLATVLGVPVPPQFSFGAGGSEGLATIYRSATAGGVR